MGCRVLPRTLLMIVDGRRVDNGQDMKTAASLACETGLHLKILVIGLLPPSPISAHGGVVAGPWVTECEAVLWLLNQRSRALSSLFLDAKVSSEILQECCEIDRIDVLVGGYARYADLTIIEPGLFKNGDHDMHCLNGALFESGRPVLLVPNSSPLTLRPKNILIAWDSGVEAARAVREALPLLLQANIVNVATVETDKEGNDINNAFDLAAYLSRHGIKVTPQQIQSSDRPVANILRQHAFDVGAELLVMGSRNHSRTRKPIFGAVTRSMLDGLTIPALMAQ